MHDAPEDPWRIDVERLSGFEILGLRVEYVGICPQCAEQLSPQDRVQLQREWS
ncbi:MAG: hypothetical protein KAY24_00630 [Candidatus Eisenbacteria sp.]|nr:hypothetical protein [Candidatus Eisenbacteria bacterium]